MPSCHDIVSISTRVEHWHIKWFSQLQFIDPFNRRDLTRDELVNLDRYLQRHGFRDLNVTEAYDAKGVILSMAGAVANTATGRATNLQQEGSLLLQAVFGGLSAHERAATVTRLPRRRHWPLIHHQLQIKIIIIHFCSTIKHMNNNNSNSIKDKF